MSRRTKWSFVGVGAACLGIVAFQIVTSCFAGSKTVVGRDVPPQQRTALERVDHRGWDQLLGKYVDRRGNVDYTAWKASAADVRALDAYLNRLSTTETNRRGNRSGQIAFWINAYNALTIKGILKEYPTTSIRNHTSKFVGYNIWKDLLITVSGRTVSLEDIEHKILRKMGDPRIHFAIVCASRSCPRLMQRAYTAENLDQQLTANAKFFFADSGNFRYDSRRGTMYLSSIMDWFGGDFGNSDAKQLAAIAPYLPEATSQRAAQAGRAKISFLKYDWGLNDQATVRTARRR